MFEKLFDKAARTAGARARSRAAELLSDLERELPGGIEAVAAAEGVRLSGRGLWRRFWLDPDLRGMIGGLVK